MTHSLFVSCAPGLEEMLRVEVSHLGGRRPKAVPGGVELRGELDTVYRLNLESGLASHVLVRVGAFRARHFEELVRHARDVAWEEWIEPGAPITVRVHCRRSKLRHTGAVEERVRAAIGARLGAETAQGDRAYVQVRADNDRFSLSIDTSGQPLHRRGYRLAPGRAPLREDLARAVLVASQWDPATPLVDPLMGSGTLVIEAALMARRLAPGRARAFAIASAPCFDAQRFDELRGRAEARERPAVAPIVGCDRAPRAVEAATRNAERAGVIGAVELSRRALGSVEVPDAPAGALVTNPPHGRRLGDPDALARLYRALGGVVARLPRAWRVAMLVSDRRLALASGIPMKTALLSDQGGTKVRVLVRDSEANR